MQRAIKLHVNVGKDRIVRPPPEFPEGPAEVIAVAIGRPAVALVPGRGQGMDAHRVPGEVHIADDFDAPLPAEIQRYIDDDEQL